MFRRILASAIGGTTGIILGLIIVSHSPFLMNRTKYALYALTAGTFVGAMGCVALGETLKLVPSQERAEKQERPPSILRANDHEE